MSKNKPQKPSKLTLTSENYSEELSIEGKYFRGPIPPPEILEKYNNIVPGSADRIIKSVENQSQHRQVLEKIVIKSGSRDSLLGIILGFIIGICGLTGGIFCVLKGHDWAGSIIAGADLAVLVGVFIYGTNSRREERIKKSTEMTK
jgi:uncharacterized membrane protein